MNRLERFHNLKNHLVIGKDFKRLSKEELEACENFIKERENVDDDAFATDANRWMVDDKEKPRNHPFMWGLVIQSIEPKIKRRLS